MLLRSGRDRGARRTLGDGLLSLRELPALFRRAGERVHVVEMGEREADERRGVSRKIQEQRHQRSSVLHEVRQPHLGRSSNARFDRCSHRRSPEFSVQTKGAPQLRRNVLPMKDGLLKLKDFPGMQSADRARRCPNRQNSVRSSFYFRSISTYSPERTVATRDAIISAFGSSRGQLAKGKTRIAILRFDRFCWVRNA